MRLVEIVTQYDSLQRSAEPWRNLTDKACVILG